MIGRIRHRAGTARRTWLVLLALAFVGQPLLVLASALHQAEHELASTDAAGAGVVIVPECLVPPTEGEDSWQGLLHLLQCHAHLSMFLSAAAEWQSSARPQVYEAAVAVRYASLYPQRRLRPPISS